VAYDWHYYHQRVQFGNVVVVPDDKNRVALIIQPRPASGSRFFLGDAFGNPTVVLPRTPDDYSIYPRCVFGDIVTKGVYLENAALAFSGYSIFTVSDLNWKCEPPVVKDVCLDYRSTTLTDPGDHAWRQVLGSNPLRRTLILSWDGNPTGSAYCVFDPNDVPNWQGIDLSVSSQILIKYCDVGDFVKLPVYLAWGTFTFPMTLTEVYEIDT
jgi:hypothetical protein